MRRVKDPQKLKKMGMTDDEIKELMDANEEIERSGQEVYDSIVDDLEYGGLLNKERKGTLTEEDEKELNRKMKVICTFKVPKFICFCGGDVVRVNHCLLARTIMGGFILIICFHLMILTSYDILFIDHKKNLNLDY